MQLKKALEGRRESKIEVAKVIQLLQPRIHIFIIHTHTYTHMVMEAEEGHKSKLRKLVHCFTTALLILYYCFTNASLLLH